MVKKIKTEYANSRPREAYYSVIVSNGTPRDTLFYDELRNQPHTSQTTPDSSENISQDHQAPNPSVDAERITDASTDQFSAPREPDERLSDESKAKNTFGI